VRTKIKDKYVSGISILKIVIVQMMKKKGCNVKVSVVSQPRFADMFYNTPHSSLSSMLWQSVYFSKIVGEMSMLSTSCFILPF
jgi:hypothetical protein